MPDMTTTVLVTDAEYRKGEVSYLAAPNLQCVRAPVEHVEALARENGAARLGLIAITTEQRHQCLLPM